MKNWQHEPIHFAPIAKLGGGWIAFKDSPSPPQPPDYTGAAQAQGAANVETARAQGRMNNPNVYTPYGSQTVTWGGSGPATYDWGGRTFNDTASLRDALTQYAGQNNYTPSDVDKWLASPDTYGIKQTSGTPSDQPTITQTLSPYQQQLLDAQNRISGQVANVAEQGVNRVGTAVAQPFDTSGLNPIQSSVNANPNYTSNVITDPQARQHAEDMAYRAATSRLDPQWQQRRAQQDTQLRNQGLVAGGEAYDAAQRDLGYQQNDAYLQAQANAVNQGLQNQQAQFNMGLQNAQLGNQVGQQQFQQGLANANLGNAATQQQIQQQSYLRSLPLNELNALRTGSQVTTPSFQGYNPVQIGQTPIFGAAQAQAQANQNIYNQQAGSANAFNGGLMNILGTVGGMYAGSPAGGAAIGRLFG